VALALSVLLSVPGASSSQTPQYTNIGMRNRIKIGPGQRSALSNFQKLFESDGMISVPSSSSFFHWCMYTTHSPHSCLPPFDANPHTVFLTLLFSVFMNFGICNKWSC